MSTETTQKAQDILDDQQMVKNMAGRLQKAGWQLVMLVAEPPVMILKVHGSEQLRATAHNNWHLSFAQRMGLKPDGDLTGDVLCELWFMTEVYGKEVI